MESIMEIIELLTEENAVNINYSSDERYMTVVYSTKVDIYHMDRKRRIDTVYCDSVRDTAISSELGLVALHKDTGISFYDIEKKRVVKRLRTGKYNFTRGVFYKKNYIYSMFENDGFDEDNRPLHPRWQIKIMDFAANRSRVLFATEGMVVQIVVKEDTLAVSARRKQGGNILYSVDLTEKKPEIREFPCEKNMHALGNLIWLFDTNRAYGLSRVHRDDKKLTLLSVDPTDETDEEICQVGNPVFTVKLSGNGRLLYIPDFGSCTIVDAVEKRVIAQISQKSGFRAMSCDHPDYFCLLSGEVGLYKVFDMAQ